MTRRSLLIAVATVTLMLGACSGDAPEPRACTDPVPAVRVRLEDFAFRPDCLTADGNARIRLENVGDAPHTFTLDGTTVDADVPSGTSTEVSLQGVDAGTYAVTCTYHPQMTATLTVEGQ